MSNKSAWQKYKESLGDTRPWDLINPNSEKSDEAVSNQRFAICQKCPELVELTSQCKRCGCFMKMKTKLEKANCPLGKW